MVKSKNLTIKSLNGDKVIWLVVFILVLVSIVAVYSSSSFLAYSEGKSTFSFLIKQMVFVVSGLIILYICYRIPFGVYRKFPPLIYLASLILMSVVVFKGVVLNSAHRWINIFGFSFQPPEVAKVATILYLAWALEVFKLKSFKEYLFAIVIPIGIMLLMMLYGSVSATLLTGIIVFAMMLIAGVKWNYIWKTLLIALCALVLLFGVHKFTGAFGRLDTATARIERFFSDNEDLSEEEQQIIKDKNRQAQNARNAIALGGITGLGPGGSLHREIIPHSYSDFIYTIIVEEWGLISGILIIFLYLAFLFRCIVISGRCSRMFSIMIVIGISLLITTQAMLHILVNVGLLPVTGQTLPLISLGGTSMWVMCAAFGIILSVSRTMETSITLNNSVEIPEDVKSNPEIVVK